MKQPLKLHIQTAFRMKRMETFQNGFIQPVFSDGGCVSESGILQLSDQSWLVIFLLLINGVKQLCVFVFLTGRMPARKQFKVALFCPCQRFNEPVNVVGRVLGHVIYKLKMASVDGFLSGTNTFSSRLLK